MMDTMSKPSIGAVAGWGMMCFCSNLTLAQRSAMTSPLVAGSAAQFLSGTDTTGC